MPYESLERDLRQLAIARRGLEELELVITHWPRDEVRGNRRDRGIEIAHDGVVVAPGILDSVFYGSELCLEIAESAGRLELRVGFDRHSKSAQRGRELALGLRACGGSGALRGDCVRSGLGYRVESSALVGGVAFYGLDQIRDEISAAFELDVDVGPGVLGADSEGDESVVEDDVERYENDDDDEEADQHSWRAQVELEDVLCRE